MNVTIMCDASYDHEHRIAGYGYWIACGRGKIGGGGIVVSQVENNNTAEMMAICNSIWQGLNKRLIQNGDSLLIQSDCSSAMDKLTSAQKAVTQQERLALAYFEKIKEQHNLGIRFRHVKGHTNNPEARFAANRACDKRAKEAMRRERSQRIAKSHIQQIQELLK